MRFKAGDPNVPQAVKTLGFPRYGVFVVCSSDWSHPIKDLSAVDDVVSAMNQEANRSEDGLAVLYADMRAHRNPTRMRVVRALSWKLAKRLERLCPKCHAPGFGSIGSRRGLPCEACGEPTHWVDFEIDGCSACGHAASRPRKDRRLTAPRLSCATCRSA
jgi:ribosomal protein L37E